LSALAGHTEVRSHSARYIYKRGILDTPVFLALKTANWLRSYEYSMWQVHTTSLLIILLISPNHSARITVCRKLCIDVAHSGAIGLVNCECDFFCY